MRRMLYLMALLCLAMVAPAWAVEGRTGHLTLLAVSQQENGTFVGSTADLYLTIAPGQGNVYIQTFPLLKVDTQISTRFAKDIACHNFDIDCSTSDFLYTIRASSPIVGGPSAGGAITALTALMLQGQYVDETISLTGTINSGGTIGPVGGVLEKIQAAADDGVKTVLIPVSESKIHKEDNTTVDVVAFGKGLGIRVVPVSTIEDVLSEMTGKPYVANDTIAVSPAYEETMRGLQEQLCDRARSFSDELVAHAMSYNDRQFQLLNSSLELRRRAEEAMEKGNAYSAASFCYGANTRLAELDLDYRQTSASELETISKRVAEDLGAFDKGLDAQEEHTLTDLEAYLTAKERVADAYESLEAARRILQRTNASRLPYAEIAYAQERLASARYWSQFYGKDGSSYSITTDALRDSCYAKIEEANERIQFVNLIFGREQGNNESSVSKELDNAEAHMQRGEYQVCLFSASKAKAEANVVLSSLGVADEELATLVDQKLLTAQRVIAKQAQKGLFPILGYSYYEYGRALKESDEVSALIYAEYALELSNLDMYFPKSGEEAIPPKVNYFSGMLLPIALFFAAGLIIGFVVSEGISLLRSRRKQRMAALTDERDAALPAKSAAIARERTAKHHVPAVKARKAAKKGGPMAVRAASRPVRKRAKQAQRKPHRNH